jgi:hypothetical protein
MDCTDAYREALIRDFAATASSTPASASRPAPSRRQAAEAGREDAAGRPAQRTDPEQDDLATSGASKG